MEFEWDEEEKSKVIEAAESLQDALVNAEVQLEKARKLLNEGKLLRSTSHQLGIRVHPTRRSS